ncbi:hypothetical protein PG997_014225 [Apiospora hydei]|uniref:Uncharacterized protein n=1 Tax=Apiospora hydei TaxID=1337664 RepID=A0ABR1UT66_9PEZI
MVAARLMSKPSVLRTLADEAKSRKKEARTEAPLPIDPRASANATEQPHGTPSGCYCRRPRRVRQRKQSQWGPLVAFDEIETLELHRPDCELSLFASGARNRKLGLAYTGMRAVASWAIACTFSAASGAGGHSIEPNFTYYPTVDRRKSPAFRAMRLMYHCVRYYSHYKRGEIQQRFFIDMCTRRISQLFRDRKANPLDVDSQNNSLISAFASLQRVSRLTPSDDFTLINHQASGCGPLSLAVLAQDEPRAKTILEASPSAIDENNILGLTPLRLALDNPALLRLLVSSATRAHLNNLSFHGGSLLSCAMEICSRKCHENPADTSSNNDRRPVDSVITLLEDDRTALQYDILQHGRHTPNEYCRHGFEEFAKQLKTRRERLKQIATPHLTENQWLDLGLDPTAVLDSHAQGVANELHAKGIIHSFEPYGVSRDLSYRSSVYHHIVGSEEADIFYGIGFRDVSVRDSNGNTPLALATTASAPFGLIDQYLDWLVDHGSDLRAPLPK